MVRYPLPAGSGGGSELTIDHIHSLSSERRPVGGTSCQSTPAKAAPLQTPLVVLRGACCANMRRCTAPPCHCRVVQPHPSRTARPATRPLRARCTRRRRGPRTSGTSSPLPGPPAAAPPRTAWRCRAAPAAPRRTTTAQCRRCRACPGARRRQQSRLDPGQAPAAGPPAAPRRAQPKRAASPGALPAGGGHSASDVNVSKHSAHSAARVCIVWLLLCPAPSTAFRAIPPQLQGCAAVQAATQKGGAAVAAAAHAAAGGAQPLWQRALLHAAQPGQGGLLPRRCRPGGAQRVGERSAAQRRVDDQPGGRQPYPSARRHRQPTVCSARNSRQQRGGGTACGQPTAQPQQHGLPSEACARPAAQLWQPQPRHCCGKPCKWCWRGHRRCTSC